MPATRPRQHGLLWKDNDAGELVPTWTASPDVSVIKALSIQHLPAEFKDIEVVFFAEGAFNRLYEIHSPCRPQRYLMRVSLPVEPFFKTESEVATLAYIHAHTSIPVPEVIAYDSRADNTLGFEWVLLEKMEGSCLHDVWEKMPFRSKVDLTIHMASLLGQLHNMQFTQIGNLYFSTVADKVNGTAAQVKHDKKFVVGRIVSPWFFRDKRVWLHADRGPFTSSHDLMLAETEIQIERVKHLSPLPTDEYFSETDEELAEDREAVLETCCKLKELVPAIFPAKTTRAEKKILYHDDLSAGNIIVDPNTYHITGIIDWESVAIRPDWDATDYPYFLKGIEVQEPPPLGTPGVDETRMTWIRRDWEKVLLRQIYQQKIRGTVDEAMFESDGGVILKRKFARSLAEIELRWTGARYWMRHLDLSTQK